MTVVVRMAERKLDRRLHGVVAGLGIGVAVTLRCRHGQLRQLQPKPPDRPDGPVDRMAVLLKVVAYRRRNGRRKWLRLRREQYDDRSARPDDHDAQRRPQQRAAAPPALRHAGCDAGQTKPAQHGLRQVGGPRRVVQGIVVGRGHDQTSSAWRCRVRSARIIRFILTRPR